MGLVTAPITFGMINVVFNGPWILAGRTVTDVVVACIRITPGRKSDCNGGEVESKNGFEEHHSARGRSKKLRFTEGCREIELGQEGRNEILLYTLGTSEDLSGRRGRGCTRPATEKYRTFDGSYGTDECRYSISVD